MNKKNPQNVNLSDEIISYYEYMSTSMLNTLKNHNYQDESTPSYGKLIPDIGDAELFISQKLHREMSSLNIYELVVDKKALSGGQIHEVSVRVIDTLIRSLKMTPKRIKGWKKCFKDPKKYLNHVNAHSGVEFSRSYVRSDEFTVSTTDPILLTCSRRLGKWDVADTDDDAFEIALDYATWLRENPNIELITFIDPEFEEYYEDDSEEFSEFTSQIYDHLAEFSEHGHFHEDRLR